MNAQSQDFLKDLLSQASPSGYEQRVQEVVRKYVKKFADEVITDSHGNVIAAINPKGSPRLMLCGHCDEIGLMVTYIDDKGYIAFAAVGGVNIPLLQGSRVWIQTANGPLLGVIGVKPIHLMKAEERKKGTGEISDLWIDIGAKDKEMVEKAGVRVGDVAVIDTGFAELLDGKACARGFDDRIGAFVVIEALRLVAKSKTKPKAAVFAVTTVQEELGLRGAKTSAFGIDPDVGIAVDVGFASDCPDVNKKMVGDITVGAGPMLQRGPNINPVVEKLLEKAARKAKITTQLQASPRATGTDANAIQVTRAGVAAGLVSVPNRYMHSPVEVISLSDAEQAAELLARFALDLEKDQDFTP